MPADCTAPPLHWPLRLLLIDTLENEPSFVQLSLVATCETGKLLGHLHCTFQAGHPCQASCHQVQPVLPVCCLCRCRCCCSVVAAWMQLSPAHAGNHLSPQQPGPTVPQQPTPVVLLIWQILFLNSAPGRHCYYLGTLQLPDRAPVSGFTSGAACAAAAAAAARTADPPSSASAQPPQWSDPRSASHATS